MLHEVVSDFISKGNTIITGPTGSGITSLTLYFANCLLKKDVRIIYYNPTQEIQKEFVKRFYPRVHSDAFFFQGDLQHFLNFIAFIEHNVDCVIIDPGDSVMVDKRIIPLMISMFSKYVPRKRVVVTSQIRQDPTKGGQVYSPIENLNKENSLSLFKYSIWLRDVTEPTDLFKERYVDIFDKIRRGNQYIRRYIAKFNEKRGNVVL